MVWFSKTAAVLLLSLGSLPHGVEGAIDEHLVTKIPGFDGPLPTRHWSGYLQTDHPNGTVNTHYWLVENSQNLTNAPTLLWQQGGPGGSSLIGFFTENGPLTLNDASFATAEYNATKIPSVFLNPHSWHQVRFSKLVHFFFFHP